MTKTKKIISLIGLSILSTTALIACGSGVDVKSQSEKTEISEDVKEHSYDLNIQETSTDDDAREYFHKHFSTIKTPPIKGAIVFENAITGDFYEESNSGRVHISGSGLGFILSISQPKEPFERLVEAVESTPSDIVIKELAGRQVAILDTESGLDLVWHEDQLRYDLYISQKDAPSNIESIFKELEEINLNSYIIEGNKNNSFIRFIPPHSQ